MSGTFPTSLQVYNRLRTDATFLSHLAELTYFDSAKNAMVDVALTSFRPVSKGGDVPWHRVYKLKYQGAVVWDRESKLYTLESLVEQQQQIVALQSRFKVMTYNVLSEDLHPGMQQNQRVKRMEALLAQIHAYDSDIVCLQEVTEAFAKYVLDNTHVYPFHAQTSELSERILILSKATIVESRTIVYPQQQQKQGLVVRVQTKTDQPVHFVGVHLTSNSRPQAKQKRLDQYRCISKAMSSLDHVVLLGDFNSSELDCMPADGDSFVNAIDQEYASFDPVNNPLAAKTSRNQIRQSYDKILLRSVVSAAGSSRVDASNTLSDHYPVMVECTVQEPKSCSSPMIADNTVALSILPPLHMWGRIQEIRARCQDPVIDKWMPHINLAHGFIPLDRTEDLERLAGTLAKLDAFPICLGQVGEFSHEVTKTFFAEPDADTGKRLQHVYNKCKSLYPGIFSQSAENFSPHLTLGKKSPTNASLGFPWTWQCDALYVVHKAQGSPCYQVVHRFPLKCKSPKDREKPTPAAVCSLLQQATATCFPGARWDVGGSGVFECADASDADLVVSVGDSISSDAFFSQLLRLLKSTAEFSMSSIVSSAHGSYIKTHCGRDTLFPVDIHLAKTPMGRAVLDESRFIFTLFPAQAELQSFIKTLSRVRQQARECQVYGGASGFVPGIGWAILTAAACLSRGNNQDLFGKIDLDAPIRLSRGSIEPCPADKWLVIATSCAPHVNVLRTMTRSTKKVLVHALRNGLDPSAEESCAYQFALSIACHQDAFLDQLQQCEAALKELIPKLIIRLDKELDFVRPFAITGSLCERQLGWRIGYNQNTTIVQHYGDKLVQKLRQLFPCLVIV